MFYWLDKGFTLNGISGQPDMFIISKPGQHGVVRKNFFDEYNKVNDGWYRTEEQAREEARYLARELQSA
jgi:hypothetical protein